MYWQFFFDFQFSGHILALLPSRDRNGSPRHAARRLGLQWMARLQILFLPNLVASDIFLADFGITQLVFGDQGPSLYYCFMKIGLISDTHSFLDPQVMTYFKDCDEIWHAGDVGEITVLDQLKSFKPTLCVYGNIDDQEVRNASAEDLFFEREKLKIFMTHIGGKPSAYNPRVRPIIDAKKPDIFICGHSHILRVITDPKRPWLTYLNPGAAGRQGFHKIRTLLRFEIIGGKLRNMQAIELGTKAKP